MRTRTAFGFLAAVVVALVVAGCGGGSDEGARDKKVDEALEKLHRELEKQGPLVGLGEASPPPSDAAQWETDFSKRSFRSRSSSPGVRPRTGSRRSTRRATRASRRSTSSTIASPWS